MSFTGVWPLWCGLVKSRPSGRMRGEVQLASVISGPVFPWAQGGDRGGTGTCGSAAVTPHPQEA